MSERGERSGAAARRYGAPRHALGQPRTRNRTTDHGATHHGATHHGASHHGATHRSATGHRREVSA